MLVGRGEMGGVLGGLGPSMGEEGKVPLSRRCKTSSFGF